MNNQHLATRIKSLRTRKGFSQEQLSDESRLSLRTIQRIEKGENVPRGDTLLKLSAALGVTPDDLMEWTTVQDNGYLTLMTASALGVVLHPMLGIIIPLCMWILKKDKIQKADETGKKLINFQITWTLMLYSLFFILVGGGAFSLVSYNLLQSFPVLLMNLSIFTALILILYVYHIAFVIYNIRRVRKGKTSRYFLVIPFLK